MFPSTFETPRAFLRPIASHDAQPIFDGYGRDPEVSRYLVWRPHVVLEDAEEYVKACMAVTSSRTYAIIRLADGAVAGAFDLRRPDRTRLEVGYVLARSSWGAGLMTEILTHVVDWALCQPGIWRIGGFCDIANAASARVMEKAGLAFEGVLRGWSVHPNLGHEPRDCFSYAALRSLSR